MKDISLLIFFLFTLTPLCLNAIIDAFIGYLYRPLTHFAALIAILGSIILTMQNIFTATQIFIAGISSGIIIISLKIISLTLSKLENRKNFFFLGCGDYRLICLTSYLCALQNPVSAIFALFFAGILMILLFIFLQISQLVFKRFSLYSSRSAPMGPAIIIATIVTLFGSIPQS